MRFLAAKPAALPHLSLSPLRAGTRRLKTGNGSGEVPSFWGLIATPLELRFRRTFAAWAQMGTLVPYGLIVRYPVLYSVTASGPNRRPAARRHSASAAPPFQGLGSSQNKFVTRGEELRTNFFRAPPRKHSLALGSRAHSLGFAMCDPSRIREFQRNGDTTMYQNEVTLIGFLGNDAEVRTNDNRSFTTLSLATKSSYKKDGKYISHTEWHRCIVFGKLSEFAGTLKKGAHLMVEGELRSRKYESKKTSTEQTIWEIRVDSILTLDRAEKVAPEDQEHDDPSQDDAAA
jgi:single-strand DNA-binding protein